MKFILKQLEKCHVLTRERMAMTKLAFLPFGRLGYGRNEELSPDSTDIQTMSKILEPKRNELFCHNTWKQHILKGL